MNALLTLEIESMAFGGHGVARHDGVVVFVFGALPGETVRVEIEQRKPRFLKGICREVLIASPHRVEPPCPWFAECGGCAYQHGAYLEQLLWKQDQVQDLVRRIGKIQDPVVLPTLPSPKEYRYRNRLTLHWNDGRFGFFDRRSGRELVEIKDCLLANEGISGKIAHFSKQKRDSGHITLRANPEKRYFEQTNPEAAKVLLSAVEAFLPEQKQGFLIDAYAGSGFFSAALVDRFDRIAGIERDTFATEAALSREDMPEARFLNGDVGELLPALLSESDPAKTVVLLDPPSEGLGTEVITALLDTPPRSVLYISCNPSTFARDLQKLSSSYSLISIQPVDMFPQTAEIELVAKLEIRN